MTAGLRSARVITPNEGETVGGIYYRAEPDLRARCSVPIATTRPARLRAGARAARHRSAPLAAACLGVPVPRPAWKDLPSWFLAAEEDRMILAENQRLKAERMKARVRMASADHMPMVTAPSAVVDIVLEAVREIESGR